MLGLSNQRGKAENHRDKYDMSCFDHTIPCAIIALATFMKPATLAPFT